MSGGGGAPRRSSADRALALLVVLALGGVLGGVIAPRYGLIPKQWATGPHLPGAPGGTTPQAMPPQVESAPGAQQPSAQQPSAQQPGAAVPPVVGQAPPGASGSRLLEGQESVVVRVVQQVRPAVVNISVRAQVATPFGLFPQEGQGSGVVVRPDGLILTNNHVVQGAQEITVTLVSGKTLRGRVLGADRFADLAVIKVDSPQPLPAAEMGASVALNVGQLAIAIGNPFGLGSTVTVGVISALNRSIQAGPDFVVENLIQTDAAINPGNSGGALLDSSGRLIGINTAIIREAQGIGFAIPIDHARIVMDQIITQGKVVRPALGVEIRGEIDANTARAYKLPVDHGVVVVPQPGSPADRAGMRPQDIIVAINGQKVGTIGDLRRELFRRKPGESVQVEVVRDGRRLTLTVLLIELRGGIPAWLVA
ncbi:MAG: trypsin-like peptidase domain-containing protein [bacterium]|nr:trypsin-like peptidase domain-containing protein [bacterium]